jgi:hypothetical protein
MVFGKKMRLAFYNMFDCVCNTLRQANELLIGDVLTYM